MRDPGPVAVQGQLQRRACLGTLDVMTITDGIPRYHLYGEGDEDQDFDFFHIETIRARSEPLGWQLEPHSHKHLAQILMITAGGGHLIDDAGDREIAPGTVIYTPAGVVHGWRFSPETEGYVVSFTTDFLTGLALDKLGPPQLQLHGDANHICHSNGADVRFIAGYFSEIAHEFGQGPQRRSIIQPLLGLMLTRTLATDDSGPVQDRSPGFTLFRFRSLIEAHFKTERRPEFYADQMALTAASLNRHCRLFMDRTVAQVLRDRAMIEARRLLAFSSLSVSQVAFELGYEDPAYFSRVFRKETGDSPQEFRARHGAQLA